MLYKKSIAEVLAQKLIVKREATAVEKNICPRCNSHQTRGAGFKKGVKSHRCNLCHHTFPSNGQVIAKKIKITKILD